MSTWCSLGSPLISFFSHLATVTLLMFFLPTDADEFVCSSSYCRPGGTLCAVSQKLWSLLLESLFCIPIAFVVIRERKMLRLRLCSKNFASAPFCIAKRDFAKLGCATGETTWHGATKVSFWVDGMNARRREQRARADRYYFPIWYYL